MNFNQTIFSSATLLVSIPLSRREIYNVCMDQPMKIISDGIWNHPNGSSPTQSAYTMLQIQMVIIFAITQAFHFILKQFGFPYFVSQVMVCPFSLLIIIVFLFFFQSIVRLKVGSKHVLKH